MSTYAKDLISRALTRRNDPAGSSTLRTSMLQFFNEVQDEIAVSLKVLRDEYEFDLEAYQGAYSYPVNRTQMAGIRVARANPPASAGDYYSLRELFEDEYRSQTYMFRPAGWVWSYFALPGWFELVNVPTEDVPSGGIISTFRIPTWLSVETPQATMELPDFCRGIVVEGMEILSMYQGRDRASGQEAYGRWHEKMLTFSEKIDDPSVDRRPSIRPPGSDWSRGMV